MSPQIAKKKLQASASCHLFRVLQSIELNDSRGWWLVWQAGGVATIKRINYTTNSQQQSARSYCVVIMLSIRPAVCLLTVSVLS